MMTHSYSDPHKQVTPDDIHFGRLHVMSTMFYINIVTYLTSFSQHYQLSTRYSHKILPRERFLTTLPAVSPTATNTKQSYSYPIKL